MAVFFSSLITKFESRCKYFQPKHAVYTLTFCKWYADTPTEIGRVTTPSSDNSNEPVKSKVDAAVIRMRCTTGLAASVTRLIETAPLVVASRETSRSGAPPARATT